MEAFSLLVERYQKMLYTVAYRFLGNPEDASDAAQEALVRAFKNLHSFRGQCSFKTWLQHIIANICRDVLRRQSRRPIISLDSMRENENCPWELPDANASSPEEVVLNIEERDYLQQLIQALSPEYRMVVIMRDLQGFTYEEIAGRLNCSAGTVKSRLSRARQALRKQLAHKRELFQPDSVYIGKGGEGR
ncbi:MAG: sigma-70 family RNA polymerase sigma factor [Clostridia bacterium]|nr:sigma-70 family RNA polymerase sigma factor [Clostridia bacterium]